MVLAPSWKTHSGKKMWQVLPDLSVFLRMCWGQGVENFLLTKLISCDIVKERQERIVYYYVSKERYAEKVLKAKGK